MERLTTDKPVKEMGMYELAHNSCYIDKDGATRYRDFETDIDARDLARNLMVDFGEWSKDCIEMTDDDSFDWAMLENLANAGVSQKMYADGLIALFYRNLWAMAELRERLKNYEQLEEQGLIMKLPYNIGTCGVIYYVDERDLEIYRLQADRIEISKTMISNKFTYTIDSYEFYFEDFGKIVFTSKEEAEAKLKELENERFN